jgi:hypothetical protein
MGALVVERHLRHAWLEYGDKDIDLIDGITFDRAVSSSALGWVNLFQDLAGSGDNVFDLGNQSPILPIRWFKNVTNPAEQGLLARPLQAHSAFLQKWIANPGVDEATSKLTFGAASARADLLAVSGHGMTGQVWGKQGKLLVAQGLEENVAVKSDGKLKYILLATCGNCGDFAAPIWLPAFQRDNPIHGILGYSETYTGDKKGALAMKRFADAMKANPTMTVLEAWEKANHGLFNWGAILLEPAVNADTVRKWHSEKGLDTLPANSAVWHFDKDSFKAGGKLVTDALPTVESRWVATDGIEIDKTNNKPYFAASRRKNLVAGSAGKLRFRNNFSNFAANEQISVTFYWIRREKHMDIDTLLTFDPTLTANDPVLQFPRITKFDSHNSPRPTVFDAIRYTTIGGSKVETIDFTVNSGATAAYIDIDDGTHGSFWMEVTYESFQTASMFQHQAWLI